MTSARLILSVVAGAAMDPNEIARTHGQRRIRRSWAFIEAPTKWVRGPSGGRDPGGRQGGAARPKMPYRLWVA